MSWANALSAADVNSLIAETVAFDAKVGRALMMLTLRIRRYGSVPADDRSLAGIAQCTRHYWNNRAWPALQDIFEVRDGRVYHPEVASLRGPARQSAVAEPSQVARRAATAQAAANARWSKPRVPASQADAADSGADASGTHAEAHPSGILDASPPHAEAHAARMPDASPIRAATHAGRMPDASDGSRAPSLSLLADSSKNPAREGESARAGADASGMPDACSPDASSIPDASPLHASAHASPDASPDASEHASEHAYPTGIVQNPHAIPVQRLKPKRSEAPAPSTRIAADWKPTPDGEREARKRGYDPEEIAAKFRDHYLGNGEVRANWDATFLNWCRREANFDGKRRQGHMTMPIQGGAAEPSAAPAPADPDAALRKRLVHVAGMRSRSSNARLAPPWSQFQQHRNAGMAWLGVMERWEAGGYRGELPPEFDAFVAEYDGEIRDTG